MNDREQVRIVMAEDDEDDRVLMGAALEESNLPYRLDFVEDGEALLAYLRRTGDYATLAGQPLPALILLDLNMPRKGGREALTEIRDDAVLRHLPVVMLSTSASPEEIRHSYQLGANSYITKPVTFDGLVRMLQALHAYWFGLVQLPTNTQTGSL